MSNELEVKAVSCVACGASLDDFAGKTEIKCMSLICSIHRPPWLMTSGPNCAMIVRTECSRFIVCPNCQRD